MVFDEAHHAVDNHPYNRIMMEFYFDLPPRTDKTSPDEVRPMILGLTASPIYGGNVVKAFESVCYCDLIQDDQQKFLTGRSRATLTVKFVLLSALARNWQSTFIVRHSSTSCTMLPTMVLHPSPPTWLPYPKFSERSTSKMTLMSSPCGASWGRPPLDRPSARGSTRNYQRSSRNRIPLRTKAFVTSSALQWTFAMKSDLGLPIGLCGAC